ncbi:ABC transporter ATP-binding protein [Actinoplanes sp. G11-F43]|uniref:ABC transporter ATP-binding protein n=1 Tax=Actinoplanes sp. G11-F43 TaxID=3424130 RepID=UPI003D34A7C5
MFNRRLLGLAARQRAGLTGLVLIGLAITATYAGQGLLIARVIAQVLDGAVSWPTMAGIAALQAARAGLLWARETTATTVAARIQDDLRGRLLARLFTLGPGWTTGTRTGRIQSTVVDGVESMRGYFADFLPQLISSLLGAAVLIGYVWTLDPVVGATIAACALLAGAAPRISRRLMSAPLTRWFTEYRALYADTLDILQGMVTLKGVNAHRRRGAQMAAQSTTFATTSTRLTAAVAAYEIVVGLAAGAGTGLAVGVGALRTADGQLDVATLLIVLLLSRECFRPLTDLSRAFHGAYPGLAAADGVFELLDTPPAIRPGSAVAINGPGEVRVENVTFAYVPGQPTLTDVTFTAAAGRTTAIVGRSGAGKSTVIALLLRFFDPGTGRILIDGHDITGLADPRALVSVVSQDTYLFHGTVRDNLLLARPGADDTALRQAARDAAAHDFITALPEGYDTMIGERGTRLSGGERQRIAIARALLKDAPILVLDEATSAIDSANEATIQEALARLARRRTTLVIAHRLSTVRTADHMVVLDDGTVAEQGPPDQLLARSGGAYRRLAVAQTGNAA